MWNVICPGLYLFLHRVMGLVLPLHPFPPWKSMKRYVFRMLNVEFFRVKDLQGMSPV